MMARIRSLADTPGGSWPSTVTAMVCGRSWGSVCVASTCATSLVPMPKASAPIAPGVLGCESPQTIVMPGWDSPSCGPMTCTMPWPASPIGCSRMPNSAQFLRSVSTWVRDTGSVTGLNGPSPLPLRPVPERRRCFTVPVASRIPRRQYQDMNNSSGVGVLDKAVSVLNAMETGPASLAQLVSATGLARPTAHRIAVALEHHRLVARDVQGRFILGPRVGELASGAGEDRLLAVAQPILTQLPGVTGGR